ncbi:thioredoxin [Streptococcus danieliae]|uniref:Thioredoxin n=1 Tax=Streptococcus danieliae TaxID=747656 RepID=A0A7X3G7T7_9STRE|nr:thioredoxin [Streptococcus danieliae]MVX58724.1 thioredoxin [Streptococcus danieliae]
MKHIILRFASISILSIFIGFIVYVHLNSLKPTFSILSDNISNLKEGELLYYGSDSCEVCQEFNKVLKDYQDETQSKIYYWDATNFATIKKAAEIKVYNTPTIIIRRNSGFKIAQGYKNLEELKLFLERD